MPLLPIEIQNEVVRWQKKLDWPNLVPSFAEFREAGGRQVFCHWDDMNVGRCEQAVEYYVRKARAAIERYRRTGSQYSANTAGRAIVWARVFRCRYISLIGRNDSTENDMPFPNMTDSVPELRAIDVIQPKRSKKTKGKP